MAVHNYVVHSPGYGRSLGWGGESLVAASVVVGSYQRSRSRSRVLSDRLGSNNTEDRCPYLHDKPLKILHAASSPL